MELHASGFNAWQQLDFQEPIIENESPDYFAFKKVLQGHKIERPLASLSHTLVRVDNCIIKAGTNLETKDDFESEYSSAETSSGLVFTTENALFTALFEENQNPKQGLWRYSTTSGEGNQRDHEFWPSEVPIRQIAAFDVGVVILYKDGSVATLGDPRFEDCLGREVTDQSPADKPGKVTDLDGLGDPVTQVAAGGYTVAAVTEGGSLYVWGTRTAGTHRRQQAFESLSGVPNYIEVDGGKDVQEVAVGESHALVLTTDGCVYAIGDNQNGQLGMGEGFKARAEKWVNTGFAAPNGQQIVGVAAGPRCSFITTQSTNDQSEEPEM